MAVLKAAIHFSCFAYVENRYSLMFDYLLN